MIPLKWRSFSIVPFSSIPVDRALYLVMSNLEIIELFYFLTQLRKYKTKVQADSLSGDESRSSLSKGKSRAALFILYYKAMICIMRAKPSAFTEALSFPTIRFQHLNFESTIFRLSPHVGHLLNVSSFTSAAEIKCPNKKSLRESLL